jgi:hypothetical protein
MDSYICLNTSDGVVVLRESALLHQFLLFRSGARFSNLGFGSAFRSALSWWGTPIACCGVSHLNVRFFVTFRFFLRLPGFNAFVLIFKFYQFFSSVNYISILVYRRTRLEWLWLLRFGGWVGGGVYTLRYMVLRLRLWAGMIVPRGYRRLATDGCVLIVFLIYCLYVSPRPHVLSNNHTEDLYAIG